jgi:hypothetical protein
MEAEGWLKAIEKKLLIAQCNEHENVLYAAHQLFRMAADWWDACCNAHDNVEFIMWNEFKANFRSHYVSYSTIKLKKKEFTDPSTRKHDCE